MMNAVRFSTRSRIPATSSGAPNPTYLATFFFRPAPWREPPQFASFSCFVPILLLILCKIKPQPWGLSPPWLRKWLLLSLSLCQPWMKSLLSCLSAVGDFSLFLSASRIVRCNLSLITLQRYKTNLKYANKIKILIRKNALFHSIYFSETCRWLNKNKPRV